MTAIPAWIKDRIKISSMRKARAMEHVTIKGIVERYRGFRKRRPIVRIMPRTYHTIIAMLDSSFIIDFPFCFKTT